jgi:hypothetical protein
LVPRHDHSRGINHLAKLRAERIPIERSKNWFSDGLYQLVCACGNGTLRGGYRLDKKRAALIWTEGTCSKCGSITITSGL